MPHTSKSISLVIGIGLYCGFAGCSEICVPLMLKRFTVNSSLILTMAILLWAMGNEREPDTASLVWSIRNVFVSSQHGTGYEAHWGGGRWHRRSEPRNSRAWSLHRIPMYSVHYRGISMHDAASCGQQGLIDDCRLLTSVSGDEWWAMLYKLTAVSD